MSRKYSVLFVALALVVAMAAGAWATSIPSFSGADQTSQPAVDNIDVVGVSLDEDGKEFHTFTAQPLWWSEDIEENGDGLYVVKRYDLSAEGASHDFFGFAVSTDAIGLAYPVDFSGLADGFISDYEPNISADAALLYIGRGVRNVTGNFYFEGSNDPGDMLEATFKFLKGIVFDSTMVPTAMVESVDADIFKLAGTVCAGGDCNTFFRDYIQVWSGDDTVTNSVAERFVSSDLNMFFYMPCGDYVKDWQVYNMYAYDCDSSSPVARSEEFVFPQDMVRYSNAIVGSHRLDVGPYVVEIYPDSSGNYDGNLDVLVERILNQSGTSVVADLRLPGSGETYFNWLPKGQVSYTEEGYRAIRANLVSGLDTAFLRFQEWDTDRTDGFGLTWYTWYDTTDPALTAYKDVQGVTISAGQDAIDLAPGFARYYVYSADETEEIEMCFDEGGTEALCQATTIEPQLWWDEGCINNDCDWSDCFGAFPMMASEAVRSDLATWTGMTDPVFTAESTACGSCEGQIYQRTDVTTLKEPFASLAQCGDLCMGASLDVKISGEVSCAYDLEDIHLVRVSFKLAPQRICDPAVRADITAAVAKLGDDPFNKPANVAPADAFLNPASVDATLGNGLDIVVRDYTTGNWVNLVTLAKANDYIDAAVAYQGIKNYFEVWAWDNMSVWEAWKSSTASENEVLLSFHVAVVNGDAPEGQAAIQAKKGYFLIYAGDANESLTNQVPAYLTYFGLMTNFDPNCGVVTPTPIPEPELIVTSDPSGTSTAVDCTTFTKESFSPEAWAAILEALEITNESAYTFSFSGVDCLSSDVAGLTAEQDVTFTVTYEDGIASAGTAVTGRNVFVYSVTDAVYDLLPEVAEEVSIATEQTKTTVIAEGSEFDANEAADALQVNFSLVSVTATANPTTTPSSGGGSGCSFGFAPLALLLLAPLALLKK